MSEGREIGEAGEAGHDEAGADTGPAPRDPDTGQGRRTMSAAVAAVVVGGVAIGVGVTLFGTSSHTVTIQSSSAVSAAPGVQYPDVLTTTPTVTPTGTASATTTAVSPTPTAHHTSPPAVHTTAASVSHPPASPTPIAQGSPTAKSTPSAGSFNVTGQVSCTSGRSVEGVWVQTASGSGFAPWQGLGNGSTSDYWYTLPRTESFSLHVGCGGTTASWAVATYSPTVSAAHDSFNCDDVAGDAGYGTCVLR